MARVADPELFSIFLRQELSVKMLLYALNAVGLVAAFFTALGEKYVRALHILVRAVVA